MTSAQQLYFDRMLPSQTLEVSSAKNPSELIKAAKEYIDQGGQITFSDDYTVIYKSHPLPPIKRTTT